MDKNKFFVVAGFLSAVVMYQAFREERKVNAQLRQENQQYVDTIFESMKSNRSN